MDTSLQDWVPGWDRPQKADTGGPWRGTPSATARIVVVTGPGEEGLPP